MHARAFLVIIIGIFLSPLSRAQDAPVQPKFTGENRMVTVESDNIVTSEKGDGEGGDYELVPYRERRHDWGVTVSLGYNSYEPLHYEPNFAAAEFGDVYKSPETPMLELQLEVKRNASFGSIGGEIGVGFYGNDSDNKDLGESSLQVIPIRLGVALNLDAISPEPYIVPYVAGGAYIVMYKESLAGASVNGNSQVAPYVSGGVALQLDWIDRKAARLSYSESGIESTYVYGEARKMFASTATSDPDFENDISWAAGIRVEF